MSREVRKETGEKRGWKGGRLVENMERRQVSRKYGKETGHR